MKIAIVLLLTLVLAMPFIQIVQSDDGLSPFADVYVDDDAAPSWYDATHVKTIPEGINNVSVGGIVYVYAGTYKNTAGTSPSPPGGTTNIRITKAVTLHGESRDSVIVDAQGRQNCILVNCSTGTVIIEGLKVINWTRRGIGQYKEWKPVIIRNNTIIGPDYATGAGNCIVFSGNNSLVEYNTIYETTLILAYGSYDGTGILCMSASDSIIRHNYVTKKLIADNGIAVVAYYYNSPTYKWNLRVKNVTVENNIIEHCSWQGILVAGWVSNITVQQNTITNCTLGVNVTYYYSAGSNTTYIKKPKYIDVKNNTIAISKQNGINVINCESNIILENNNVTSNNWSGIYLKATDVTVANNTVENNTKYGIEINTAGNLIYNNIFRNVDNAWDDSSGNRWNVTKVPGTNIIGGPYIAGNFWFDYNGSDGDGDELGDTETPYTNSGKILIGGDNHPLYFYEPPPTKKRGGALPPDNTPITPQVNNESSSCWCPIWLFIASIFVALAMIFSKKNKWNILSLAIIVFLILLILTMIWSTQPICPLCIIIPCLIVALSVLVKILKTNRKW